MKRKLLIISLILSSLMFAQGDNGKNQNNKMGNEIEKMGCPFTRRTSVNKRQRRNPRKWIRR